MRKFMEVFINTVLILLGFTLMLYIVVWLMPINFILAFIVTLLFVSAGLAFIFTCVSTDEIPFNPGGFIVDNCDGWRCKH